MKHHEDRPVLRYEVVVTTHLRSYAKIVVTAPDAKAAFQLALKERKNITEWFTDPVDIEKVSIFAFKELPDEPEESLRPGRALVQRPPKKHPPEE